MSVTISTFHRLVGAAVGVQPTCEQTCKVYDVAHELLGVYNTTDYGYYQMVKPVTPPPVLSYR